MKKTYLAATFVIDVVFAIILFYFAWSVFFGDGTFFGLGETASTVLAVVGVVLATRGVIRAYHTGLALTGNASSQEEEVPEYGYRDEWERENL